MGERFPTANYRQITRVAKRLGFYLLRQVKGSHEVWKRDKDSRYTTIPNHGNRELKRKTVKSILNDLSISPSDFINLK